jgi:hypothetical protein
MVALQLAQQDRGGLTTPQFVRAGLMRLDGPFAYQFSMPLFQTREQLWPVSSKSVKEQLSAILAAETSPSPAKVLSAQTGANLPEKVPEFGLIERLPL